MQENIKVENNLDRNNKSEVTHVFIKDEYGRCFNTGLDTDAVSDRAYNAPDKIANFDHTFITFEDSNKGVLKRHNKKIEFQKDVDNEYEVAENSDQLTIKEENDGQSFINEGTEIVLNSTETGHVSTKLLIKCEDVEELKIENGLDIGTCRITDIIGKYSIKYEG